MIDGGGIKNRTIARIHFQINEISPELLRPVGSAISSLKYPG